MMQWHIELTQPARQQLADIKDRRVRTAIASRIDALRQDPERQGKALIGELAGYRSLRAVGQRYRIVYRVEADRVLVYVVTIGMRKEGDKKDIYELARKLLRQGLLEPPAAE